MSTADPRLSRYGQFQAQQQSQQPQGLLALSLVHGHQNGATNGHQEENSFQFESDSHDENDDDEDEIGRRHAAPSKRKIVAAKQAKTQPQPGHTSGVFLETDIDSSEVQVRGARSVGDLQVSPGKDANQAKEVSPSDRDKSKSVNFGREEENTLMKRPSVHDMRVDKSLERINVPEWYREGGDDEEDRRVFRLRSVHDDDGYWDEENRQARGSVFVRTKSAPPSRKPSTSNVINAIDAIKQSRQWTLSRAVGAESRASTTVSVASNFRRPSVRYAEKDASLRRPKPIAIRTLDAVVNNLPPKPPEEVKTVSQRTVTEIEVKTSNFSYTKTTENVFAKRNMSPPPMKQPLHVDPRFIEQPVFHKPEQHRYKEAPMQIPVQAQRAVSPPGPATMPKPSIRTPSPVQPVPVMQPIPITFTRKSVSPPRNDGVLVMEEEFRTPPQPQPSIVSPRLVENDLTRRPVLLAGYTEAEFIDTAGDNVTPMTSLTVSQPNQVVSPSPPDETIHTPSPQPVAAMTEPTPFVLHNKPVVQPFHHPNGYTTVPTRSSRVTDIDDAPIVSITPPAQTDVVVVSPPIRMGTKAIVSPPHPKTSSPPAVVQVPPITLNVTEQRVSSPPTHSQQPSPLSWRTTTILQTQPGLEEIVIDTAVQVSTRRTSGQVVTPTTSSPTIANVEQAGETAPVQVPEPVTQLSRSSAGSSLRASFKKPGKLLAKLWKDKDSHSKPPIQPIVPPTNHEDETVQMPPPPPPPVPPPEPEPMASDDVTPTPAQPTPTEKPLVKNGPARASFRALFFRDKSRDRESSKEKKPGPPLSKSSNAIASSLEEQRTASPTAPVNQTASDMNQTSINESMTISEFMSTSVVSEPPTKPTAVAPPPQKKTSVFSPAKWISARSPSKEKAEKKSAEKEKPAVVSNGNAKPLKNGKSATVEPPKNLKNGRDDVAEMLGDAPTGYKPCKLPDEQPLPQAPPPPPLSAMSNGSSKPNHHLSQSSVGDGRDPDSISTTSSQKKRSRNILQSIMHYQEEHDHGGYSRQYVPPPTGEAASWLHRKDVPQLVNNAVAGSRPSQPNTPAPGSPTSGRSMTLPSRQQTAPDSYSLHSQGQASGRFQPDFSNLSASYHAGMTHAVSKDTQQQQPPSGPYSKQMSAASQQQQQQSSNYQAQMAHQQKIRQQMPPPPQRLNPAAMPPHPQINVPPPSRPIVDFSPPVTCQRPGCNHTVSAEQARTTFRICDSCASAFCSRQCREAHLVGPTGRKKCPLDNVRDLCQRAAKRLESDRLLVALLSQFARMSYLCHGRGYVYAHFSGPERAAAFSNGQMGLHSLALEFHTVTHTEAALVRGEPLDEVMDLLQAYNPESKLVLCVGVSVAPERASARPNRPAYGVPGGSIGSSANQVTSWDTAAMEDLAAANGESRVVLRAAKLRLAVPRPGSLRALLLVSAGVAFQNRRGNVQRMRELTFSNIQMHLKRRGVDLLASHPNVYTRLTQYVAGTQEFPPTGLCIWDDAVGRSLLALLFPEALPRQDWLRSLHQLGDVELGLPDPRQMAMGVDV